MKIDASHMDFLTPQQYQSQNWKLFFEIENNLRKHLPEARIEHIGSSAIENCISKGDLDIFIGVSSKEFEETKSQLKALGYKIKEGSLSNHELCPFYLEGNIDVGIQLVVSGSEFEYFLKFRDILKNSRELVQKYNDLKNQSRNLSHGEYRQIKSTFIQQVLQSELAQLDQHRIK